MDYPSHDSTDVFLYISARFQVQFQVDGLRLLSIKDLKVLQRSIQKCHVAMFEKPRVAYHFHDMAMHHSSLATFYKGAGRHFLHSPQHCVEKAAATSTSAAVYISDEPRQSI